MNYNFSKTLTKFLALIDAKVTKTSLGQQLKTHPENGTMLAYSDTLTHFNIENAAAEVSKEDLLLLPTPFITHSRKDNGIFMVVKSVSDTSVLWFDTAKGWVREDLNTFISHWNMVVLFAEANKDSGEENYTSKLWEERREQLRIPVAIALVVSLLLTAVFKVNVTDPITYTLLSLKVIGMILAGMLLAHSIGSTNRILESICGTKGTSGCNTILNSKAAKVLPWLSLADIGFIYFYGSFFGLLLCLPSTAKVQGIQSFQLLMSMPALVFSLYSIYYQAFKAKQWCKLCLGVVSLLLIEGAIVLFVVPSLFSIIENATVQAMGFGFVIPIAFLLLFKKVAVAAQRGIAYQKDLSKLKSNPDLFGLIMASQPTMPRITEEMKPIILGDKSLNNTITLVSNPLCRPCALMHQRVEKLISDNPKSVNCRLIFSTSRKGEDYGVKFIETIYSLPKGMRVEAIHRWYSQETVDYDFWKKKHDHFKQKNQGANIRLKHNEWCNTASIKYTPTIYFNGQKLPELYEVEDVLNHLEDDETSREEPVYGFANHLI